MKVRQALQARLAGPLARAWLAARRGGRKAPPGSVRILIFHDVRRHQLAAFSRLVDRLAREHGLIEPADAEAALLGRAGSRSDGRAPCLLSFDDGFKSNYSLAREVLEPRGVRALFFVCPGLIDLAPRAQKEAIARNIRDDVSTIADPDLEAELMTWGDVRALAEAGHRIGSHSWSHRRLARASAEELEAEIGRAERALAERLKEPPRWFAYPFGDVGSVSAAALARVAKAHRFCRSGVRGLNALGTPPLGLLAQHVDLDAPLEYQLAAAAGALDFRYRSARAELAAKLAEAARRDGRLEPG